MRTDAGRLIDGRYRLTERIGSGGMGTVWRAVDELMERDVAVKQPRLPGDPDDAAHQRAAHRIHREARAAARVDHPAAVSIHDVVVEDGSPWIIMELVRGESLDEALRRGPLAPVEAARIGLAVVGALDAAHRVGIVHRDVKPANVLLGPGGRVVLTDFGIAHVQGEESLTATGEFVGSLEFIAPERMSGRNAGPASDLWSLGVLLYAAVEGWSPFRRTTVESTLAAVLAADPPEPERAGPLAPLIGRLLVKEPEQRPGAQETRAALEAVAEGWPVPDAVREEPARPQDVTGLREFTEDAGTFRLGAAPSVPATPEATTTSTQESPAPPTSTQESPAPPTSTQESLAPSPSTQESPAPPASPPTVTTRAAPRPGRRFLLRPAPAAALGVLLMGGAWLGTSYFGGSGDGGVTEEHATYRSAPGAVAASPAAGTWTVHREPRLDAIVSVPAGTARDSATDRTVTYGDDTVRLRLTREKSAPTPLTAWARQATASRPGDDAHTLSTPTSFHGDDAMLTDTTYRVGRKRYRVLQLLVVTAAHESYALRVDMPKGTPDERRGTALFKGARDRLKVGSTLLGS
ncbi:serine/threonine-protein kinase [Streptomyces gibsoniae]|uniref:non-specific serine/threonine protein kinase n=1 Tax=Streptomyces gibsoniae TaxID=3075529 RepID=A0ABU2TLF1_9ACTN|nr:protein kinase [Streptomyces sp. DSM 41699]MDT0461770.1 protein kinase [Streptomyces sp. DSM 41699]